MYKLTIAAVAAVLLCSQAALAQNANGPVYEIACRGPLSVRAFNTQNQILYLFNKAPAAAGVNGMNLKPGECAWQDRPVSDSEPDILAVFVHRGDYVLPPDRNNPATKDDVLNDTTLTAEDAQLFTVFHEAIMRCDLVVRVFANLYGPVETGQSQSGTVLAATMTHAGASLSDVGVEVVPYPGADGCAPRDKIVNFRAAPVIALPPFGERKPHQ